MKYFILRNEKNIAEISEKLYKDLTPKRRKLAETALLKENPELKKITKAKKGYLVRIPRTLEGHKADRRKVLDPYDQIANDMLDGFDAFETHFAETFTSRKAQQKDWASTLAAASKELKQHPKAGELTKALKKNITESRSQNTKQAKRIARALAQLKKTAAEIED